MKIRPPSQSGNGQIAVEYTAPMPIVGSWLLLTLAFASLDLASPAQNAPSSHAMPTVASPFPHAENSPLAARITALLLDPAAARAHWGIAVAQLDGTPVFGVDEGKLFRPASTAKLFTAAAAMALLGPDTRFSTSIYGDLDSKTGIVHGDLTLLGGGDPDFGTHDLPYTRQIAPGEGVGEPDEDASLATLAEKLIGAGITRIEGNILGDDTLFQPPSAPDGWAAEDLLWGYGALPSALSIGDNQLRITVRAKPAGPVPGRPFNWMGSFATVDQLYPYLQVMDEVLTLSSDPNAKDGIGTQALSGAPQLVRVFGRLSPSSPPATEIIALNDPAAYAAGALRALLLQHGIGITGTANSLHRPPDNAPAPFLAGLRDANCDGSLWGEPLVCAYSCLGTPHSHHLIAEHTSPPLSEDITFTLKTSANLHAELLLHHIGLKVSCPGVTTLEGARVLRNWLLHIGLADHDFLFFDGSGLSTKDLVTPRAEAQLLAYAATQPWFPQWKAAMPVGGVDGTLAARFTEAPLNGHVFAKTGTLGESRALAGYLQCASGKEFIVSVLVDNHEPGTAADRLTMDKIVAAIAANN